MRWGVSVYGVCAEPLWRGDGKDVRGKMIDADKVR